MTTAGYIFEVLKRNGSVTLPGFGEFFLKNSKAVVDADKKSILPPSQEVNLRINYEISGTELADFISKEKNISAEEAFSEIEKQASYWKNQLNSHQDIKIPELGDFYHNENEIVFRGRRIDAEAPDFYGLEEINLNYLKKSAENKSGYKFNKTILWSFLILIPIMAAAVYFLIGTEGIFGKKSFQNPPTVAVKPAVTGKKTLQDTIKTDTLKNDSVKTVAAAPAKKWAPKKYKKNTWRKAKRRTNR